MTAGAKQAKAALGGVEKKSGTTGVGIAKLAKRVAALGAAYIGLRTVIGTTTAAFKRFGEFEGKVVRAAALTDVKNFSKTLGELSERARELGATTVFTAGEVAEGMQFMAMAGNDANTTIAAMPKVLQLATAANLDLATSADIVTNVMTVFGKSTAELGKANDILVAAFTNSNTSLTDLASAMKFVGPVANTLGVTMEETAAAIGIMGNAGLQGEMAGTALRGVLAKLVNPAKEARAAMKALGLTSTDASKGFRHIVAQLEEVRGSMSATAFQSKVFQVFGQRAGPGLAALVDQGTESLDRLIEKIGGASGLAAEIEAAQLDTFSGQMALLKSAIDDMAISFARNLAPSIRSVVEELTLFISALGGALDRDMERANKRAAQAAKNAAAIKKTKELLRALETEFEKGTAVIGPTVQAAGGAVLRVPGLVGKSTIDALDQIEKRLKGLIADQKELAGGALFKPAVKAASVVEDMNTEAKELKVTMEDVAKLFDGIGATSGAGLTALRKQLDAALIGKPGGGLLQFENQGDLARAQAAIEQGQFPLAAAMGIGGPQMGGVSAVRGTSVSGPVTAGLASEIGSGLTQMFSEVGAGAAALMAAPVVSGLLEAAKVAFKGISTMLGNIFGGSPLFSSVGSAIMEGFITAVGLAVSAVIALVTALLVAAQVVAVALVAVAITPLIIAFTVLTLGLGPLIVGVFALASAYAAAVGIFVGAAFAVLSLATQSDSFERFSAVLDAALSTLVSAVEPVFRSMMPLAGGLALLAELIGPVLTTMSNFEIVGKALFVAFKFLTRVFLIGAIVIGRMLGKDGMVAQATTALAQLGTVTWEASAAKAEELAITEELNDTMSETIINLPAWYNAFAARGGAAAAEVGGPSGISPMFPSIAPMRRDRPN